MRPSPSIEQMTLLPQFKEYKDVIMVRGGAPASTGRHGIRLVTPAHTFTCAALITFAVITGFIGTALLIYATGLGDTRQRSTAASAGFTHLGVGVCSLFGAGAVGLHSYRKEKAIAEQQRINGH